MGRIRTLCVAASSAMAATALGVVPAVVQAGASAAVHAARTAATTGASSTETTPACGTVPAGYAMCLVRVRHKAGAPQSSSPTGYAPSTIETAYGFAGSDD
ncbi:MAG TPA: hypothetical protein VMD28_07775, partial [Acidimicrobiales bacterium]|nr:hypothetical protein [Acidimicrobiales bacterium]